MKFSTYVACTIIHVDQVLGFQIRLRILKYLLNKKIHATSSHSDVHAEITEYSHSDYALISITPR